MSKLIEQFLETHRQSLAENSIVNINMSIDRETLEIYAQAQNETQKRSKNKSTEVTERILNNALTARLTLLLAKTDLLNADNYRSLREAIRRWCPWQAGQQQACIQVRKVLLTLLPAARQKQQLGTLCQEYKAHLATEIEKQVKNDHPQAYLACSNSQTALCGAEPIANRPQIKIVTDKRSPIERLAAEPARYIQKPDKPLTLVLQKYQTISQLEAMLATPVKSATEQVKDFNHLFKAKRSLLEKDRDSLAMKFIKGVATVLSLGIAWSLGIWGIKGKAATDKVQKALEIAKITPRRTH